MRNTLTAFRGIGGLVLMLSVLCLGRADSAPRGTAESGALLANMTYVSSTTVGVVGYTFASGTNQAVICIQIVTTGTTSPLAVTSFELGTTGCTNAAADITNAKLYYTGTTAVFSTGTQFGATTNPNASNPYQITSGGQTLSAGTNYFWLTVDVTSGATIMDVIKAGCTQFMLSGVTCNPSPAYPGGTGRVVYGSLNGAYTVGSGGDFPGLKEAFDQINAKGLSGSSTLSVTTNLTLAASAVLNQWTESGGSGYTLTITPAAATTPTISGSIADGSLINLNGADRVTIDGSNSGTTSRDMTIINSSSGANTAAIKITSLGTGAGATNNTIRNCNISTGTNALTTYGIFVGGATLNDAGDDNDNLTIQNNSIIKAEYGVWINASETGRIQSALIKNNSVGSTGASSTYITIKGIYVAGLDAGVIEGNEVFNVISSQSWATLIGIDVDDDCAFTIVRKNLVHGIHNTYSLQAGACGISITGTSGSSGIRIENNMVRDILTVGGQSVNLNYNAVGMRVMGSTGHLIYHNSVNMTGTFSSGSASNSMAFAVGDASAANLDVRNNIFANGMTGAAGTKSYAISFPQSYSFTGSTINNNDYYANGSYGVLGLNYQTDVTTIAAWRTFTGQDGVSVVTDPAFVSASDLHNNSGLTPTLLESGGAVVGTTTDYDGDARPGPAGSTRGGATAPDIGADEFDGVPIGMVFTSSTTTGVSGLVGPGTTDTRVIGIRIVTENAGSPLSVTQFDLSTAGTTSAADISVAKLYYTGTSSTFAATNQFGSTVSNPSGAFTISGSRTLAGGINYFWLAYDIASGAANGNLLDAQCTQVTVASVTHVPTVTAPAEYLTVQAPLNGTYTVGSGGTYATLNDAFSVINQVGLAGNSTLSIISNITQSAPAILNQWTNTPPSSNHTLTIQPGGAALRTISYTPASGEAAIELAGADRVTIDGLNTGGNALTISALGSNSSTAAIWLASQGGDAGCVGVTIRNITASANGNTSATQPTFGIYAAGTSISAFGTGADNNTLTIQGCTVTNAWYGIYASGTTDNKIEDLQVLSNTVGTASSECGYTGIRLGYASGALISGNDITGIPAGTTVQDQAGVSISTGATGTNIRKNAIHDFHFTGSGGYGSNGILYASDATATSEISNNRIYNITGDGDAITQTILSYLPLGIAIKSGGNINIWYNTIYMSGGTLSFSGVGTSACILATSGVTGLNIRNNILQNSMTGTGTGNHTFGLALQGSGSVSACDNNVYYINGASNVTPYIGFYNGTSAATLGAWQTASSLDANSVNGDPRLTSATDLTVITGADPVPAGSDMGAAVSVATDCTGAARSASRPDAGAYEFTVTRTYSGAGPFTAPPGNIDNLTVNTTSEVSLSGGTRVQGTLTLTQGLLTLGSYNLTLGPSATIGGTPAAGTMVNISGAGQMRKEFGATGSFTFPIGETTGSTEYSPMTLNFTGGSFAAGAYAGVRVVNAKHPGNTATNNFLSRYWSVSQSGITGFTCNATATYTAADVTGDPALIYTGKLDGSTWTYFSQADNLNHLLVANGISGFSDFSGGPLNEMPVELVAFHARYADGRVDLDWKTATETNCDGFEVQRRADGDWQAVGFVQGAGSSSTPREYRFADARIPSSGDLQYRLKQIDRDGRFEFSGIASVTIGGGLDFALYPNHPNPFTTSTSLAFNLPVDAVVGVTVYDITGRPVLVRDAGLLHAGYNRVELAASGLMPGAYVYAVRSGREVRYGILTITR